MIICPFIVKAQNIQFGDSLIIKNNAKAKELYLKLKLPKNWRAEDVGSKAYSTLGILYNNSKTNKIFITFDRSAHYTRDQNKARITRINKQGTIKYSFFHAGQFFSPYPFKIEIFNQTKLTVDTYPALMIRAKVVLEENNLGEKSIFYRTSFRIFHKGLAIQFNKDSQYEIDSKKDQQLLESMAKSIIFPKKDSNEQIEAAICGICLDVNIAHQDGLDIPPWKSTMEKYLGFKGNDEEFKLFFNNFLNTYKNQFICPRYKVTTSIYPSQHLFKRILAMGMDQTFEEYFFYLEDGDIDYNAYEIVNGKKETILDWVENWIVLGRGDVDELRDVASSLEDEFGAKYGKDLPD